MGQPISSQELGAGICRALGLDITNIVAIKVECALDTAAQVTVTRHILDTEMDCMKDVFERYNLAVLE